ncbi:MAG: hypothetical protein PWQ08_140 [Clostridiales bacterium]|nr:hypothetical protein [Clostridiales bacterium]
MGLGICWVGIKTSVRNEMLSKNVGRVCGNADPAYSLPKSQSTDTFKISAKAFSSKSDTGRFCPSKRERAGMLMSIPAVCNFDKSSTCFIPCFSRASVTRAPIMFLSPSGSFRFFIVSPLPKLYRTGVLIYLAIPNIMKLFGDTKYKKVGMRI